MKFVLRGDADCEHDAAHRDVAEHLPDRDVGVREQNVHAEPHVF